MDESIKVNAKGNGQKSDLSLPIPFQQSARMNLSRQTQWNETRITIDSRNPNMHRQSWPFQQPKSPSAQYGLSLSVGGILRGVMTLCAGGKTLTSTDDDRRDDLLQESARQVALPAVSNVPLLEQLRLGNPSLLVEDSDEDLDDEHSRRPDDGNAVLMKTDQAVANSETTDVEGKTPSATDAAFTYSKSRHKRHEPVILAPATNPSKSEIIGADDCDKTLAMQRTTPNEDEVDHQTEEIMKLLQFSNISISDITAHQNGRLTIEDPTLAARLNHILQQHGEDTVDEEEECPGEESFDQVDPMSFFHQAHQQMFDFDLTDNDISPLGRLGTIDEEGESLLSVLEGSTQDSFENHLSMKSEASIEIDYPFDEMPDNHTSISKSKEPVSTYKTVQNKWLILDELVSTESENRKELDDLAQKLFDSVHCKAYAQSLDGQAKPQSNISATITTYAEEDDFSPVTPLGEQFISSNDSEQGAETTVLPPLWQAAADCRDDECDHVEFSNQRDPSSEMYGSANSQYFSSCSDESLEDAVNSKEGDTFSIPTKAQTPRYSNCTTTTNA